MGSNYSPGCQDLFSEVCVNNSGNLIKGFQRFSANFSTSCLQRHCIILIMEGNAEFSQGAFIKVFQLFVEDFVYVVIITGAPVHARIRY